MESELTPDQIKAMGIYPDNLNPYPYPDMPLFKEQYLEIMLTLALAVQDEDPKGVLDALQSIELLRKSIASTLEDSYVLSKTLVWNMRWQKNHYRNAVLWINHDYTAAYFGICSDEDDWINLGELNTIFDEFFTPYTTNDNDEYTQKAFKSFLNRYTTNTLQDCIHQLSLILDGTINGPANALTFYCDSSIYSKIVNFFITNTKSLQCTEEAFKKVYTRTHEIASSQPQSIEIKGRSKNATVAFFELLREHRIVSPQTPLKDLVAPILHGKVFDLSKGKSSTLYSSNKDKLTDLINNKSTIP